MKNNIATIEKFYTAFQQLDYATMNSCYSHDVVFSDPVFGLLRQDEVKYMWQMLCTNATNFSLTFNNIVTDDDEYYTCNWVATYTFSLTGRKVVNICKAYMRLQNGIIIEHSDAFNFYRWCRQALGLKGLLFGWTGFMQKQIQKQVLKKLNAYINKHKP